MTIIAVLLSLVLERTFAGLRDYRSFLWYERYTGWIRDVLNSPFWDGPWGVLLVILPPVLLTGWIAVVLSGSLFHLLELLFAIVILFYTLGPKDLDQQVDTYLQALEEGDRERANAIAGEILHAEVPANLVETQQRLGEAIFIQTNERVMAVIFWFVLLGPMGAMLYRLSDYGVKHSRDDSTGYYRAISRLQDILAYLPAHLCAIGFALAGSFEHAWRGWQQHLQELAPAWQQQWRDALIKVGMAALCLEPQDTDTDSETPEVEQTELDISALQDHIRAILALVWRTVVIWLVIIALSTLLGFSS